MRTAPRVLITAIDGDLGQALFKALRLDPQRFRIFGTDLAPSAVGASFVERTFVLPRADAPDYVDALAALVRAEGIDAIVPASEAEIAALGDETIAGAVVIAQPRHWTATFSDKLLAMRAIRGQVRLAPFADGADPRELLDLEATSGYPLVVKPRRSSGSRQVRLVRDRLELDAAISDVPDPVVQAHIGTPDSEYSVGVFRGPFEDALVFRRTLRPGTGLSWDAESVLAPDIAAYALDVARAAGAKGSTNVQLRLTAEGPRLVELNPRFSSLVAARALCGFTDLAWSVRAGLGLELARPRSPYHLLRFRRYFHEVVDLGAGPYAVAEWLPRSTEVR